MFTQEKMKLNSYKKERTSIIDCLFDEWAYNILTFQYHLSLFTGGIFLLAVLGKLGWLVGFSWLFLSKFLSHVLVRLDISINVPNIVKLQERRNNSFINLIN